VDVAGYDNGSEDGWPYHRALRFDQSRFECFGIDEVMTFEVLRLEVINQSAVCHGSLAAERRMSRADRFDASICAQRRRTC
jgi:hypothetical protein